MCLPSNSVTHGGIPLPLYKWRLNKCLLHPQINFVIARIAMDVATANRLSAIDAEMRQLQQAIQNRRRTLNFFLRNIRALDSFFYFFQRGMNGMKKRRKEEPADSYVCNLVIRDWDHILQRKCISLPTVLSLLALNGRRRSVKPLNCL